MTDYKPPKAGGWICPGCAGRSVGFESNPDDNMLTAKAVVWCEKGHVTIYDGNHSELVYDFNAPKRVAC